MESSTVLRVLEAGTQLMPTPAAQLKPKKRTCSMPGSGYIRTGVPAPHRHYLLSMWTSWASHWGTRLWTSGTGQDLCANLLPPAVTPWQTHSKQVPGGRAARGGLQPKKLAKIQPPTSARALITRPGSTAGVPEKASRHWHLFCQLALESSL